MSEFLNVVFNIIPLGGYGKTLLKPLRGCDLELPLTLGRDFCGTILRTGHGVGKAYNVGDKVYGFIPLNKQGTFSEVILANKAHVSYYYLIQIMLCCYNKS